MPATPSSLEDLTVDYLTDNVGAYVQWKGIVGGRGSTDVPLGALGDEFSYMKDGKMFAHPFFPTKFPQLIKAAIVEDESCPMEVDSEPNLDAPGKGCMKPENFELFRSPHRSFPLPPMIGNKLLARLNEKGLLHKQTLPLFNSEKIRITKVELNECDVDNATLEILVQHRLEMVKICNIKGLDVGHLVDRCLSADTKAASLRFLDLSGSLPEDKNNNLGGSQWMEQTLRPLTELKALSSLNLSGCVAVDDACLALVADHMPRLEYLNVSETKVSDISPVVRLAPHLRSLILYKVKLGDSASAVRTLLSLRRLEVLDVSDVPRAETTTSSRASLAAELISVMTNDDDDDGEMGTAGSVPLEHLRVLDVSGLQGKLCQERVKKFLLEHPALLFLGLLLTDVSSFREVKRLLHVEVAGDSNRKQILCALKTYTRLNRQFFVSRTLNTTYSELHDSYEQLVPEEIRAIFQGVSTALSQYPKNLSIQMAGTACLYELCRQTRAQMLQPAEVRAVVERSLDALEHHPATLQLHKNVWLTLCNDYILQSGHFDLFRCCTNAMESMVSHADNSLTRMTVAIVSILAAKIPTERMTSLGTNERYMKFMLNIIAQKLADVDLQMQNAPPGAPPPQPDLILKFTLSALWNLTDESPQTCTEFVKNDGLDIVLKVVDKFDAPAVQTKVLGLLNNVAEVAPLKRKLMEPKCLEIMLKLLASDKIDVSYFSAGILAHLCIERKWTCEPSWQKCMDLLEETIGKWESPETEMVAYRSFTPFFALLCRDDLPGVQLWAVWAIRHVCSKNQGRYVAMFIEQKGVDAIKRVLATPENQRETGCSKIKEISREIMNLLSLHEPSV